MVGGLPEDPPVPPLAALLIPLLLPTTPPRLDADGLPLPAEVVRAVGSTRFRGPGPADAPVPSPDGKTIYTVHRITNPAQIIARGAATGRVRHRIDLTAGTGTLLAATRDRLRVADTDGGRLRVYQFDAATGRPVGAVRAFPGPLRDVPVLSPDGRRVACHAADVVRRVGIDEEDIEVFVFDADTGRRTSLAQWRNPGPDRSRVTLWFSADGTRLVVATGGRSCRVLDTATGAVVRDLAADGRVSAVAFSPGGETVAAWVEYPAHREPSSYTLHTWDVATGAKRSLGTIQKRLVTPPIFSPDGKLIGTRVQQIGWEFRDAVTGAVVRRLPDALPLDERPMIDRVGGGAFSPDGKAFYSAGPGPVVLPYDLATGELLPQAPGPPGAVTDLAVGADGTVAALAGRWVVSWGAAGRPPVRFPAAGADPTLRPERLSADGEKAAFFGENGSVLTTMETRTGKPLARLAGAYNPWFTADGSRMVGNANRSIVTWDAAGTPVATVPANVWVGAVSPDGRWAVTADERRDGPVIRDLSGREPPALFPAQTPAQWNNLRDKAFDPNGRFLVTLSNTPAVDRMVITVTDLPGGRVVRVLPLADRLWPSRVRVAPGGRFVAATGPGVSPWNDTVLIELATGKIRHRFGHPATALAFTPDGRQLATADVTGPIYLWDVCGELSKPAAPPGADGLDVAWADLASDDAAKAFQAIRLLAHFPGQALPFLREKLRPEPGPTADEVAKLVAGLDAPAFADREKAEKELKKLGRLAGPALRAAAKATASAELRQRAERLLAPLDAGKLTAEQVRAVRAVEAVEWMGTPAAKALLREWATGAAGATLTTEARAAAAR